MFQILHDIVGDVAHWEELNQSYLGKQSSNFQLNLADSYLKALVRNPFFVQFGNNAILKVERSELGTLVWKHSGNLLSGHEPHYTYLNPRKTELEISNAGPKQAGVYEVFLKEGGCEKREEVQVQTGLYSLVMFLASECYDMLFT